MATNYTPFDGLMDFMHHTAVLLDEGESSGKLRFLPFEAYAD